MNIVLVGFMGAGKTTVGRRLAARLGYRFIDVDCCIEQEQGCPISEIFHYADEKYFRRLETDFIKRLQNLSNVIVSTGGGILTTEGNLELLHRIGKIFYLKTDLEETFARIKKSTNRPLLNVENPKEKMVALFKSREHFYQEADITIETTAKNIYQITNEIIHAL